MTTNSKEVAKLTPFDQETLLALLNQWEAEIQGWDYAAEIAAAGGEKEIADRNRARAFAIKTCQEELKEILQNRQDG